MSYKIPLGLLMVLALTDLAVSQRVPPGPQALYTMTNATQFNEVVVFTRKPDGSIAFSYRAFTGGKGTGTGLGNQGGVVLSSDGRWLLVVNAGSNQVTVFSVKPAGLLITDVVSSGGVTPVSVAIRPDNLVYVVHSTSADIQGFCLTPRGKLMWLMQSRRLLSAATAAPAQIGFSRHGRFLLVTEKATNNIRTFSINASGYSAGHVDNPSAGKTPFAFGFGQDNRVFVAEVFNGAEDAGAVSSYRLGKDGRLTVIDASVQNTETAPCWLVVKPGGGYLYTTNTPDDSISGYAVEHGGKLVLLDADGRTAEPGSGTRPLDMGMAADGRYLYTLNSGAGRISGFRIMPDGSLIHLGMTAVLLPRTANGLAVF